MPPAVVALRELHMLHGIAEFYNRSPVEILAMRRQAVAAGPLPIMLESFLPSIGITARPMNTWLLSLSQRMRSTLGQRLMP
ncbi:MAG TPA: hypothetical protein VE197_12025 [Mycobacterium sp.]|nr:hypothetical protein [Mycobacterium sp.]